MSRPRTAKAILREITSGLQRELMQSQQAFIGQLSSALSQFQRQADSTFDGKSWGEASWPALADSWEALIKEQIELLARLRSDALLQWLLDQQKAYEQSAISQLQQRKLKSRD